MKPNKKHLPEELLENFVLGPDLSITSVKKGLEKLAGRQKDLEAIHICIDHMDPSCYRKKEYFHISKLKRLTRLDEWIYKNLVDDQEYGKYLKKYTPLKKKLKYGDVDEYILNKHYRSKAINILSRQRRKFNFKKWTKQRFMYDYRRKTSLFLKDGSCFHYDFRNILTSIFVLRRGGNKQILAVGGGGSSGQRLHYTIYTAIFYLLGKKKKIKHYLLRYNSFNQYVYVDAFNKPIVTWELGSNYPLDDKLIKEIRRNGIELRTVIKREPWL